MIGLLAPAGLLGLLALALPAVLHLRRPPPPTVRLGSVRHLAALPGRRRNPWRWQDRLRLALRLALLTLLALALARPLWRHSGDPAPPSWSLVDPAVGTILTGSARERLDARRIAGDEVHLLADGFPEVRAGDSVGSEPDPPAAVDVWSLLRELDARLPVGSSLTIFSPARLDSLRGERPNLHHVSLVWVETPAAPGRVVPGRATTPAPAVRVVILHTPERTGDARRLAEGVRAGVPPDGSYPAPVIAVNPAPGSFPAAPDWVFCLGGARPETLAEAAGMANARNLFTDAGDAPPRDDPGGIPPGPLVAPELAGGPEVLLRQVATLPEAGAVHWRDAAGRPVLTVARVRPGERWRWRFHGRFDPAWNDLTTTSALAEVLRAWCFPVTNRAPDSRLAGAVQATPRAGIATGRRRSAAWPWSGVDNLPGTARSAVDLRPWALALAAAGFLLERFWAFRRGATHRPVTVVAR